MEGKLLTSASPPQPHQKQSYTYSTGGLELLERVGHDCNMCVWRWRTGVFEDVAIELVMGEKRGCLCFYCDDEWEWGRCIYV